MMIIDHSMDRLFSYVVLLFVFFTLPFTFSLQKMTWKSRQADVDTCRMKGKHKVEKTHTHTFHLKEQMFPSTITKLFQNKSRIIQCRKSVTDVISHSPCFFHPHTHTLVFNNTLHPAQ